METPELLDKLLRSAAPSGYEGPAAEVWREAASFAELSTDGLGSSIARVGEGAPLLAVVGHIDEIGLVVTHIDEKGFLYFKSIGGWDPQILVGQRVEVRGRDGLVPGVVGRKPIHLLDADQRKKVVELKGLHIDVGAGDRDEAAALVRVGDPVTIAAEPGPDARQPPDLPRDGQPARRLRRPRVPAPLHTNGVTSPAASPRSPPCRRRSASSAPEPPPSRCGPTSRSRSTSPTPPTPPGSTRRSWAAMRSAPARRSAAARRSRRRSSSCWSRPRRRRGSSTRSRPAGAGPAPTPTRSRSPARGSRRASSRSRSATCTRPVEMVDLADVEATVELLAAFAARLKASVDLSR